MCFTLPRRRRWKKSAPALSIVTAEESRLTAGERPRLHPELQPVVSVTSSSGTLDSGPRVEIALKLVDKTGLVVDMNADEAVDLANELLTAVRMSERKYELKFGIDWRGEV